MELQKPRGTRDFLPEEMRKRRYIEKKLREVATRWGYGEIKTPTFEHIEPEIPTLMGYIYLKLATKSRFCLFVCSLYMGYNIS
jgi:hypothetical protein